MENEVKELKYQGVSIKVEDLIEKIINFRDEYNKLNIQKYTINYIVSIIEKDKITLLERTFKEYDKKGVDIIDFVRIFLNIIEHQENETLYLVMALLDLFRVISENLNMATHIKYVDVTNYICDSFGQNNNDDYIIPTKKLPETKKFKPDNNRVREIDIDAPVIYGKNEENIKRLIKQKFKTDSSHHNNQSIKMGFYAKEIRKVFTLDSLADKIHIYDLNCVLKKKISPKSRKDVKDIIILSFAWSNRQRRIGATLKDFSLIFWDSYDNFEFEKSFSTTDKVADYQTNIWFIEFMNSWITTDRLFSINIWDLDTETLNSHIQSKAIKSNIIDIVEIPYMKLVAIGSLDKIVTVWNLKKKIIILTIELFQGGIHSLQFFSTYQVFITAGYENSISVFNINPHYLDHSLIGKLQGHTSMVTAFTCIENSPMIVSADDNGIIKVWDIRSFKCLQTLEVGCKSAISKLINVEKEGKICFIGSRVNFIDFDEKVEHSNKEQLYPIKIEHNYLQDEFIIATSKDIRFFSLSKGQITKIFQGLLNNPEDEITAFKTVEHNRKLIIGDHKGQLSMYCYDSGEFSKQLQGHDNEITSFKVDYGNSLIISAGWDSKLQIQKEGQKQQFELYRTITSCFFGKEITLMEVSVYHNMIVTCGNCNEIYFWDYEYCKMISCLELDSEEVPTAVTFINGYGVFIIATCKNRLLITKIEWNEQNMEFKILSIIDLEQVKLMHHDENESDSEQNSFHSRPEEKEILQNQSEELGKINNNFANKLLIDITYQEKNQPSECLLYIGLLKGQIRCYDLLQIFKHFNLQMVIHANQRMNYNAFRKAREDFLLSLRKMKISPTILQSIINEDQLLNLSSKLKEIFQAHKEQITNLSIITLTEKKILTSSMDCYLKIWNTNGQLIGSFNINHPLPILWNIQLDTFKRT